jgi:type VI secretion system VasD/TssJ family lipoprotein
MKSSVRIGALLLCGALCCSCTLFGGSSADLVNGPKAVAFRPNAITLDIKSDPYLNLYQEGAHPVYLCIYQLKEPNWFIQSVAENDGIENLMSCGRLDQSVALAKRVVVQPGRNLVESADRAEGARYLGLVAGYYDLRKETSVRLYEMKKKRFAMSLELGPKEIQQIKVK